MTTPLTRAALYLRCASEADAPRALSRQTEDCTAYTRKNDLTIVAVYQDVGSAATSQPGMAELVSDARRSSFDVVVVTDASRISRDIQRGREIRQALRSTGVEVVAVNQPSPSVSTEVLAELLDGSGPQSLSANIRRAIAARNRRKT